VLGRTCQRAGCCAGGLASPNRVSAETEFAVAICSRPTTNRAVVGSGSTLVRIVRFAGANDTAGDTCIERHSFAPTTVDAATKSPNTCARTLVNFSPFASSSYSAHQMAVQLADRSASAAWARSRVARRGPISRAHADLARTLDRRTAIADADEYCPACAGHRAACGDAGIGGVAARHGRRAKR